MKNKSNFLQTAQNATEQQFAEAPVYVEEEEMRYVTFTEAESLAFSEN